MLSRAAAVSLALAIPFGLPAVGSASERTPTLDELVTDGPVEAIARASRDVYVGGRFTYAGARTGAAAVLSTRRSRVLATGSVPEGVVADAVPDGRGGFFVALGSESSLATQPVRRVLANGTVDRGFRPALRGYASAIALAGGRLYLGGRFTAPAFARGLGVVALDATTGRIDPGFAVRLLAYPPPSPTGHAVFVPRAAPCAVPPRGHPVTPPRLPVASLVPAGGRLWMGGPFREVEGKPISGLAAVDLASGEVEDFPATGPSGTVSAMEAAAGRLYIARQNAGRAEVVAMDPHSGVVDPTFSAAAADVTALAATRDRLYVGRDAVAGRRLMAFDMSGRRDSRFAPPAIRGVGDLLLHDGRLYAAGTLAGRGYGVFGVRSDTGAPTSFVTRSDGPVWTLARAGGRLLAGGAFTSVGGAEQDGLLAFDVRTHRLRTRFHANGAREVSGLAATDERLFASGRFVFGDRRARTLVALDPRTGRALPRFRPPDSAAGGWTLARIGGMLYAAGRYGGPLRAFDARTGRPLAGFAPPLGHAWSVAASGSRLYALGKGPRGDEVVMALGPRTGQPLWRYPSRLRVGHPTHVRGGVSIAHDRVYVSASTSSRQRGARSYRVVALDPASGRADPGFRGPWQVLHGTAEVGQRVLAVGSGTETALSVFDARTGVRDRRFDDKLASAGCAALALGRRVFVGGSFWIPHPPFRRAFFDAFDLSDRHLAP